MSLRRSFLTTGTVEKAICVLDGNKTSIFPNFIAGEMSWFGIS
jgi:hypothetical protein